MNRRSFSDCVGVLAGVHILVADDNADLRLLMEISLEMAGARVSLAGDGPEALASLNQDGIDLLICDAEMPGMDGRELCRRLRAAGRRLPVIVVSGHVGAEAALESTTVGANAHLDKPFPIENLVEVCRRVLLEACHAR